jgi:hypothetical protein
MIYIDFFYLLIAVVNPHSIEKYEKNREMVLVIA